MKKTIEQVERQLQEALGHQFLPFVPEHYKPQVSLYEGGRKKRRSASVDNWSPESGEIRISFRAEDDTARGSEQQGIPTNSSAANTEGGTLGKPPAVQATKGAQAVTDLVRALNRAESRPGYEFVALKWFRDSFLPAQGFQWASSDSTRQDVLRSSIEQRIVLTSKVPNPKAPQFPVTAIRLNRQLPQVSVVLGGEPASEQAFSPVEIRGEGLSATILRERR